MSKSDIRKTRTKFITTKKTVGWEDATTGGSVMESGVAIYIIPRKAEVNLNHIQFFGQLNEDPLVDRNLLFAIARTGPENATLLIVPQQLIQKAIAVMNLAVQVVTAVGVLQIGVQMTDDIDVTISRSSNLSDDDDYTIVPVYRASVTTTNFRSLGILYMTEKLTQDILKDTGGWEGYTFEESAS